MNIGTRDLDLNKKTYRFELSFSFLKSDGLTSLPCVYIYNIPLATPQGIQQVEQIHT